MKITKNMTVKDVKVAFRSIFPLLKVEFYTKKHKHFQGSKKADEAAEDLKLGTLNPGLEDGVLNIPENMTVDQFETALEKEFGLHVQVFRKSGDQWLQTSITDNWTLKKQELKAEELSKYLAK